MYATRSKKIKTNRRNAFALCEACRLGAYWQVHRAADARRHLRAQLAVRETLGVNPVTVAAFIATIDGVGRFADARQVRACLGLVPSEHCSSERRHRWAISKVSNTRLRTLLVESALALRCRRARTETYRGTLRDLERRGGLPGRGVSRTDGRLALEGLPLRGTTGKRRARLEP